MMTRVSVLFLGLLFLSISPVCAAVTVTPASGGSAISADTSATGGTGAWTTLGTITIAEGNKGDIGTGTAQTLAIKIPAGFEFNTASIPSVSFTAGLDIQSASVAYSDAATLVVTFSVAARDQKDTLRIGATGLQVRPTAGTPLATGRHLYRPSTGGGTASINGISTSSNGSSGSNFGNLTEVAGAAVKLGILLPGQTAAPGTASGRTGTPLPQTNGQPFNVQVRAGDAFWNLASANHQVRLSSTDTQASLPPAGTLSGGSITLPVTLRTEGSQTLTASDLTNPSIAPDTSEPVTIYPGVTLMGGPLVAIHDSELTRALALTNAAATTPSGVGTTGKEWWPTNWNYFVLPESVKEALRSDGTAFEVVSDSDIRSGKLLGTNGQPRYPILISLGAEAVHNDELSALTNYVGAGGFVFAGGSAFTRFPDGKTRGDFGIAAEMGISSATPSLTNWTPNRTILKVQEHRLAAGLPAGTVRWQMPVAADATFWGTYPHSDPDPRPLIWDVYSSNANTLVMGDGSPWLTEKAFGQGRFIWYAPMQPLIGHSGWSPSTHAYLILREAIEWAFESSRTPVMKLSPWRYPDDAALMVRHDLENYAAEINNIEVFAAFEKSLGAKGSYYFCTGTLREDMDGSYDTNAVIASLRRALSNYNCVIGPHNGGLPNPAASPPLAHPDYDYWHWGPDEALDLTPNGYSSGREYARISISNSVADVERWFPGQLTASNRTWVSPYFNATREPSLEIQAGLNLKVAGDQKLSPFPHWTLSSITPGKRFGFVSLPVSDWFAGARVAQSIEAGHTEETIHASVDYYYQLGGLINLYGHLLRTNGLQGEYVRYAMDTNLHPRVWSANAMDLYQWWTNRSKAQVTAEYRIANTNQAVATFRLTGAADTQTAVELLIPDAGTPGGIAVYTNGTSAGTGAYRVSGRRVKVLVGATVTNAEVRYTLGPRAGDDTFAASSGPVIAVPAPGLLRNDAAGLGGSELTPVLVTPPAHGDVSLQANGSFTYTPNDPSAAADQFSYRVEDGVAASPTAFVSLSFGNGNRFTDDFARAQSPAMIAPWVAQAGNWTITNGSMQAGPNANQTYSQAYLTNTWQDFAVEGRFRFEETAFGGGLGGRVDPETGARYAAWIYPEGSSGGANTLKLVKFYNWTSWTLMQEVNLAAVGTNWQHLKLAFNGNQIAVWLNQALLINASDEFSTRTRGGVSLDLWTGGIGYRMVVDDVKVMSLLADDIYEAVQDQNLSIAAPGVLANDADLYGLGLGAFLVKSPARGTINLLANGGFGYVPQPGYFGQDTFIYETRSGTNSLGSAWGIINVKPSGTNSGSAPLITSILASGTNVTLTWTATAGRKYRLQSKPALQGLTWVDIVPDIVASSTTATGSDTNSPLAQKYYRVVLLP